MDSVCGFSSFMDGMDDEGLPTAHIAGDEDAILGTMASLGVGVDITAGVAEEVKL